MYKNEDLFKIIEITKDDEFTCPVVSKDSKNDNNSLKSFSDMYSRAFNLENYSYITTNIKNIIPSDKKIISLKKHIYSIVSQDKNLITNNINRCYILSDLLKKHEDSNLTDEEIKQLVKLVSQIRNLAEDDEEFDRNEHLCEHNILEHMQEFTDYCIWLYHNQNNPAYNSNDEKLKASYENNEKIDTEAYKYVVLPRDIIRKIQKIEMYFKELKPLLKYNPKTGFYSFEYKNVSIDVVCSHIYMLLNGESLSKISYKCYQDGTCIYCGQQMLDYNSYVASDLPQETNSLIYSFLQSINNISQFFTCYYYIFDEIYKIIHELQSKRYLKTKQIITISALFILKLIDKVKESKNISWKPKKLKSTIGKITEIFASSGIDSESIKELMKKDDLIKDLTTFAKNFVDLIKQKVNYHEEYNPIYIANRYGDNKIKELYKNIELMKVFNDSYYKMLLKLWDYKYIDVFHNYISNFDSLNIKFKNSKINSGKKFFEIMADTYCPVNEFHEYEGSSCKHCGIKKDCSNTSEIYNKYIYKINENFLNYPSSIQGIKHINQEEFVKKIEKLNEKDFITKLNIDSNDKNYLQTLINNIENNINIRNFISSILHIPKQLIPMKQEFYIKSFIYMLDNSILDSQTLFYKLLTFFENSRFLL